MSYGFEIRDNEGTLVVSNSPVFHVKQTIGVVTPTPVPEFTNDIAQTMFYGYFFNIHKQFTPSYTEAGIVKSLAGTWELFMAPGGRVAIPPNVVGQEDIVFVQLGGSKYLCGSSSLHFDFPDLPVRIVPVLRGTITNARVMSPTPPPTAGSGDYGMQLFNGAGTCVFDSRLVNFGIPAAYVVNQSIIQNILVNNTTHDITLPFAMPNCWVATPFFEPFSVVRRVLPFDTFEDRYSVKVEQINDTTLRLSRVLFYSQTRSTPFPNLSFYTQTLVLFVMRNA